MSACAQARLGTPLSQRSAAYLFSSSFLRVSSSIVRVGASCEGQKTPFVSAGRVNKERERGGTLRSCCRLAGFIATYSGVVVFRWALSSGGSHHYAGRRGSKVGLARRTMDFGRRRLGIKVSTMRASACRLFQGEEHDSSFTRNFSCLPSTGRTSVLGKSQES